MKCDIEGVVIRELKKHHDQRGWLVELFRHDEIPSGFHPVMSYVSLTKAGIARGPHEHKNQSDIMGFIGPATFRLYLWDNRPDSLTYRQKTTIDLGENNNAMVLIPAGVVHAYRNIGTIDGIVYNAPNRLYAGADRQGPVDEIRYEDDPGAPFKLDD